MTQVGLYSIGVRGLEVPDLLNWAYRHRMGFVHLRGGPRGYDVVRQDPGVLERWRRAAATTVPITGVTADLDLSDIHALDPRHRCRARAELAELTRAARIVGAGWVRLIARHPLTAPEGEPVETDLPVLIELHDPGWWEPGPHRALLDLLRHRLMGVLADTAQLDRALAVIGPTVLDRWQRVASQTQVLHLSDDGSGLSSPGHAHIVRDLARRSHAGHRMEVAVEWTGPDRTPETCLRRHHALAGWWRHVLEQETPSP